MRSVSLLPGLHAGGLAASSFQPCRIKICVFSKNAHSVPIKSRRIHSIDANFASRAINFIKTAPGTALVAARTGAYISVFGTALLLFPHPIIQLLTAAQSALPSVGWIRVGGTLASLFGFYYIGAALDDCEGRFPRRFYQATVWGRVYLSAVFTGLVATGQSEPSLLILAVINALSAWLLNRQLVLRSAAAAATAATAG